MQLAELAAAREMRFRRGVVIAEAEDEGFGVRAVTREAMVQSALLSAARAEELGMPKDCLLYTSDAADE